MEHGPAVDAGQDEEKGRVGEEGLTQMVRGPADRAANRVRASAREVRAKDAPWGPRLSLASSAARSSDFSLAVSAFVRSAKICVKDDGVGDKKDKINNTHNLSRRSCRSQRIILPTHRV